MPDSDISQIFLNERFVFVQASSQDPDTKTMYYYTWVLNRGDRTYTHAFQVIKHPNAAVRIDLNFD